MTTLAEYLKVMEERIPEEREFPSILTEANKLVNGDRADSYGDSNDFCFRCAKLWEAITDAPIEPRHIPLMMIGMKLLRQEVSNKQDNLVDIVGYTIIQDRIDN